ncbi:MAG TPA: TIGR00730 family Rossman fold protein [Flavisolibacter sp.]|nr:TIGR00730 family Rossman fold protein [Flavisolibacter sp.]
MDKITKLAIFCGSKTGSNELYAKHAAALGALLATHKVELIYGGGKRGLMGIAADEAMRGNGIVRGVIPRVLTDWEHQHNDISELLIVDDMHIRKRTMYQLCDAAIILPGGFGTLDELFEILTWNVLSIHNKKIFILNSGGFYDHILQHMQRLEAEGFLWEKLEKQVTILEDPAELVQYLQQRPNGG